MQILKELSIFFDVRSLTFRLINFFIDIYIFLNIKILLSVDLVSLNKRYDVIW